MEKVCGEKVVDLLSKVKLKPKVAETLSERRKSLYASISGTLSDQNNLNVM